jgi:hypothetical protein
MLDSKFCPLTGLRLIGDNTVVYSTLSGTIEYKFKPIGRACISDEARAELRSVDKNIKSKIAGICRNAFENGEDSIQINTTYISDIQKQNTPSTVRAKASHLLKHMYSHGGSDYEEFSFISDHDYPLVYGNDAAEFNKIIKLIESQGYIQIGTELGMAGHTVSYRDVTLTDAGISHVESQTSTVYDINIMEKKESNIDVFISHSSNDTPIVRAVIELLRSSLNISADKIRCTSVEGYKLPAGAATDNQIKQEVCDAKVLLGVISPASVNSMYVAFELGARWGIGKPLVPLTTSIVGVELLKGPLKGINALNSTLRTDLLQLITDLGKYLGVTPQRPAVYDNKITDLMNLSLAETLPTKKEAALNDKIVNATSQDEYLNADAIINQHCESEWPDDYSMRVYCIQDQKNALSKLKQGKPKNIPEDIFAQIRRKAALDWPTDFVMRSYAENEQISAYMQLHLKSKN